jgi:hypothetical protein
MNKALFFIKFMNLKKNVTCHFCCSLGHLLLASPSAFEASRVRLLDPPPNQAMIPSTICNFR